MGCSASADDVEAFTDCAALTTSINRSNNENAGVPPIMMVDARHAEGERTPLPTPSGVMASSSAWTAGSPPSGCDHDMSSTTSAAAEQHSDDAGDGDDDAALRSGSSSSSSSATDVSPSANDDDDGDVGLSENDLLPVAAIASTGDVDESSNNHGEACSSDRNPLVAPPPSRRFHTTTAVSPAEASIPPTAAAAAGGEALDPSSLEVLFGALLMSESDFVAAGASTDDRSRHNTLAAQSHSHSHSGVLMDGSAVLYNTREDAVLRRSPMSTLTEATPPTRSPAASALFRSMPPRGNTSNNSNVFRSPRVLASPSESGGRAEHSSSGGGGGGGDSNSSIIAKRRRTTSARTLLLE